MVLPTTIAATKGLIGGTYDATVELLDNAGDPYDLSQWSWSLDIEGMEPLTPGAGLTLDSPTPGNILIKLGPDVTVTIEEGKTHMVLTMTNVADPTSVYFPVVGDIDWSTP
jgi:hypothetical protein